MIEIQQMRLRRLQMRLKHPFKTSFGAIQDKDFFIIEAEDASGNRGYGESVAFSAPWYTEETTETVRHMMRDFLLPILQSNPLAHPDEVSQLFAPIRQNRMAKAALEGAVWDLYAKQHHYSLAHMLGGTQKAIDVGVSIGIQSSTEVLFEKIETYLTEGYKRVKLKIKPGHDIDVVRRVRERFPDLPLMVDANSAYTLKDMKHLKKLDAFDLMMIEQPLDQHDLIYHAALQEQLETPICLDECILSLDDAKKAIELGSCQIINLKIGRVGGLTEAKRIHDYCKMRGVDVWCGGMLESGIGRAHNVALSTLVGFTLPGDTAASANYWKKDIINPAVTVENGTIQVPDMTGIGYPVDEDVLDYYTVESDVFAFV